MTYVKSYDGFIESAVRSLCGFLSIFVLFSYSSAGNIIRIEGIVVGYPLVI